MRELREETGLHAASFEALGQLDVAPGMSSQRGWVFLATGITEGESDREHEEQDMRSAWFSRADVEQMISSGVITDAQTGERLRCASRACRSVSSYSAHTPPVPAHRIRSKSSTTWRNWASRLTWRSIPAKSISSEGLMCCAMRGGAVLLSSISAYRRINK